MKVLFIGSILVNEGPANVNREILKYWDSADEVQVIEKLSKQTLIKLFSKIRSFQLVIADGFYIEICALELICRLASVPFYCLMHGYMPFENAINNLGYSVMACKRYDNMLKISSGVIVLSELQKRFLVNNLPQLKEKTYVCPMGLEQNVSRMHRCEKNEVVIAVSGGTRPIKRNKFVLDAINAMSNKCDSIRFCVYGENKLEGINWLNTSIGNITVDYRGHIAHSDFLEELASVDLFVMASKHEPFGISAIDAVHSGAAVLLSENCGVNEVFNLLPEDIIFENDTEQDVANKINNLLKHSNNSRLQKAINYNKYNWKNSIAKLREFIKIKEKL